MADSLDQAFNQIAPDSNLDQAFNQIEQQPQMATPQAQPSPSPMPQPKPSAGPEPKMVNVVDPDTQEIGSIPAAQLSDALHQGFSVASPEMVDRYIKEQKYGTPGQQLITALEGAGVGASFGLSTGLEQAFGVDPEDIRARREVNPGAHMAGEMAGLAGSALIPGVGEANILGKAGAGAARAVGLGAEGAGVLSKIGASAVKNAVETMMVQGGSEVSRMLAQDPHTNVETALTDIGLAGLIGGGLGGGFGAISPLWKATMGNSVGRTLDALAKKAGGIESIVPDEITAAMDTAGMSVPAEVRASFSKDPEIQKMFQSLQESATSSGTKAQQALSQFKSDAADTLVSALGKTPEEVSNLVAASEYELGNNLKNSITNQLKQVIDPISEKFNAIKERFSGTELPQTVKGDIATKVGDLASAEGYALSPTSAPAKEVGRVLKELPNLKTLEDLRKYQSIIGDNTATPELFRVGKQLKGILRDAESDLVTQTVGARAPELLADHASARTAYKSAMDLIDGLNERLHVGKYSGPDSFLRALGEMTPEDVLRRLTAKNDVELLNTLKQQFPEVAQQVRDYHLNQLLTAATKKAGAGETLNPKALFNALEKMSPEMRSFVVPEGAGAKIDAVRTIMNAVPSKMNPSGTAKALDAMWSHLPNSAIGMATALMTHNPLGFLIEPLAKWVGRDAPDAIKLGLLKFLGSSQQIESEGFKAMVDFIHHTIRGENLVSQASKNVFKTGAQVLPQSVLPTEKDRKRLDKSLKALQTDQSSLLDVGGKTAQYLPEQGQSLAQTAANATNYLNSLRPATEKKNPLDSDIEPSSAQRASFNRALDIAQQPLLVLDAIKKGTVTVQDIQTMSTLYPSLYNKLSQKLGNDMMEHISKGQSVPYQTRLGLSLFMGQPLDSTMTPQAIQATQAIHAIPPAGGEPQPAPPKIKHGTAPLAKLPSMYMTPQQARAKDKLE